MFLLIPDGKKAYEYDIVMERSLNEYMTVAAVIYGATKDRHEVFTSCLPVQA